ncbi:hypothetical protein CB1_000235003 [Camelus ferus]|nr:hypothetical protein CB1_000235003 [Camelus ferus]
MVQEKETVAYVLHTQNGQPPSTEQPGRPVCSALPSPTCPPPTPVQTRTPGSHDALMVSRCGCLLGGALWSECPARTPGTAAEYHVGSWRTSGQERACWEGDNASEDQALLRFWAQGAPGLREAQLGSCSRGKEKGGSVLVRPAARIQLCAYVERGAPALASGSGTLTPGRRPFRDATAPGLEKVVLSPVTWGVPKALPGPSLLCVLGDDFSVPPLLSQSGCVGQSPCCEGDEGPRCCRKTPPKWLPAELVLETFLKDSPFSAAVVTLFLLRNGCRSAWVCPGGPCQPGFRWVLLDNAGCGSLGPGANVLRSQQVKGRTCVCTSFPSASFPLCKRLEQVFPARCAGTQVSPQGRPYGLGLAPGLCKLSVPCDSALLGVGQQAREPAPSCLRAEEALPA